MINMQHIKDQNIIKSLCKKMAPPLGKNEKGYITF